MGNRAVITLDQSPTINSLGIYLHWNGGPESVLAFAQAAHDLGALERMEFDNSYAFARLVQVITNWMGGTLSVGVDTLGHLDHDNGDNGLFVIRPAFNKLVTLAQYPKGLTTKAYPHEPRIIDRDSVKHHAYWEDNDLWKQVMERNAAPFGEWRAESVLDAAPEMLEALRFIAGIASGGVIERHETGKPTWHALDEIKAVATQAIKAAAGE